MLMNQLFIVTLFMAVISWFMTRLFGIEWVSLAAAILPFTIEIANNTREMIAVANIMARGKGIHGAAHK